MRNLFVIALAGALAAGCASIMDEKTQVVSVETPWCHKAACTLRNDGGAYYAHTTPTSLVINKSGEDLIMVCEKAGKSSTTLFESSANGYMTAGNVLLFGGLIGLLVDDGSGAGYDYDTRLISNLDCGNQPDPDTAAYIDQLQKQQDKAAAATDSGYTP